MNANDNALHNADDAKQAAHGAAGGKKKPAGKAGKKAEKKRRSPKKANEAAVDALENDVKDGDNEDMPVVAEKKVKKSKPKVFHPSGARQMKKIPRAERIRQMLEPHVDEACPLCLEKAVDMKLECGHIFHKGCLQSQLDSQWSGVRIGFNYLQCAMCRSPIQLPPVMYSNDILGKVNEGENLRKKIEQLAADKIREDDLYPELKNDAAQQLAHAMEKLAFYKCVECQEPYCGGLVDCGRDLEINEKELRCQKCVFALKPAGASKFLDEEAKIPDLRCLQHGYKHAMFKCDSCCAIATWDCIYNHYCDRCHGQASVLKNYPCPGADNCKLGIPHPPNGSAVHCQGEPPVPFVIGCMKCIGWEQENQVYSGAKHMF
eukprot:TRINITY_DN5977_c1_g1_i1.p1 TRINITY_DN5977_c1_g1~~TRINITY_DN5977_c1_g1_i1.p1  ORF type:complete len:375 (+),score=92.52 TRINITY_DN5977_c1_g1_i1:145-1269(+)